MQRFLPSSRNRIDDDINQILEYDKKSAFIFEYRYLIPEKYKSLYSYWQEIVKANFVFLYDYFKSNRN